MIIISVQLINYDDYYPMMTAGLLFMKRTMNISFLFLFLFSSDEEADETVTSPDNIDDG